MVRNLSSIEIKLFDDSRADSTREEALMDDGEPRGKRKMKGEG